MKKLLGLVCIFVIVLLSSCELLGDLFDREDGGKTGSWYEGNISGGEFWAQNMKTGKHYKVHADRLVEGDHCTVWVEKNCGVTQAQAKQLADHFDKEIYPKMINNFSIKDFNYGGSGRSFSNVMDLADWFTNTEDDKLCILLLDIKDNYDPGNINPLKRDYSYVAGYFWAIDFFQENGSNGKNMIYIDTYPAMLENVANPSLTKKVIENVYSTLAHEMQHMMNFVTTLAKRSKFNSSGGLSEIFPMNTWIDEGLSAAAEYVSSGNHSENRIEWFNKNGGGDGRIDRGNNFFVWGNYNAVLDDYATVYLFFQWLRLQGGGSTVYSKIISSSFDDYRSVADVMNNYSNWDQLLQTWLAANYINAPSGQYGYMNDSVLRNVKAPAPQSILQNISLAPGEGVYSQMNAAFQMPSSSGNIQYASLSKSTPYVNSVAGSGRILLSYNVNTDIEGSSEVGTTTGVSIPSTSVVNITFPERSAISEIPRPYKIDAADITGRDKFNDVERILKRKISDVNEQE